jgi:hypothetical protein
MNDQDVALDQIKCPNCGTLIPVSEAISHQIAERTRAELRIEASRQQKAFAAREAELSEKEAALERTIEERVSVATALYPGSRGAFRPRRRHVVLTFHSFCGSGDGGRSRWTGSLRVRPFACGGR